MQPTPANNEIDGYLVTREVEELTGYSRRWLSHLIKAKQFPAPDAPGRCGGAAHRWRRSTIKRALAEMAGPAPLAATEHAASAPRPPPKKRRPPRATATA